MPALTIIVGPCLPPEHHPGRRWKGLRPNPRLLDVVPDSDEPVIRQGAEHESEDWLQLLNRQVWEGYHRPDGPVDLPLLVVVHLRKYNKIP